MDAETKGWVLLILAALGFLVLVLTCGCRGGQAQKVDTPSVSEMQAWLNEVGGDVDQKFETVQETLTRMEQRQGTQEASLDQKFENVEEAITNVTTISHDISDNQKDLSKGRDRRSYCIGAAALCLAFILPAPGMKIRLGLLALTIILILAGLL